MTFPALSRPPGAARLAFPLALSLATLAACDGETVRHYRSEPNLPIPEFEELTDSIFIDDAGFVTELEVELDIQHPFVSDLDVSLLHVDTGTQLRLLSRPRSGNDDLRLVLGDDAPVDIQDDVVPGFEADTAFPEPRYRPLEPLEFAYGEPLAGEWRLRVYDTRSGETGVLGAWAMDVHVADERPAPALAVARPRRFPFALAQGVREAGVFEIRRLAGLAGELELRLEGADGVSAIPATIAADQNHALLVFGADRDARLGARELSFRLSVGDVERRLAMDAAVVPIDRQDVELMDQLALPDLGAPEATGNDVWGWTDPTTGSEYALMGTSVGTAFVDVTAPAAPVYLGQLPTHTEPSLWRDIKVYADHAFIVSEAKDHGVQVFDLTQLRGVDAPRTFAESARFGGLGSAHNLVVDEQSGFVYAVGAKVEPSGVGPCTGGMVAIDVRSQLEPRLAGCFSGGVPAGKSPGPDYPTAVYTHDAQCVIYRGPDVDYQGRELCFTCDNSEQDGFSRQFLGIVDMTDKANPVQVARIAYEGGAYAHQGWLTEDQTHFLLNDEGDELADELAGARTYIFDVTDLAAPVVAGAFDNPRRAIGHNAYVVGDRLYQANYTSGLRIVDLAGIDTLTLAEIAHLDTYPDDDASSGELAYAGAWSVYPFFASGTVLVSDIERGLFVVRPTLP